MHKSVRTFRILSAKDSSVIIYNLNFGDYLHNATLSSFTYDLIDCC